MKKAGKTGNFNQKKLHAPTNSQSQLMLMLGQEANWIISVDFYFFYMKTHKKLSFENVDTEEKRVLISQNTYLRIL